MASTEKSMILGTNNLFYFNFPWKKEYGKKGLIISEKIVTYNFSLLLSVVVIEEFKGYIKFNLDALENKERLGLRCKYKVGEEDAEADTKILTFPKASKYEIFSLEWPEDKPLAISIDLGEHEISTFFEYFNINPRCENHDCNFFAKSKYSDVTLHLEYPSEDFDQENSPENSQEIPAHKAILASKCAYFQKMFDYKVSQDEMDQVILKGRHEAALVSLLRYIYGASISLTFNQSLGIQILIEIYEKAEEWELEEIKWPVSQLLYKKLDRENAQSIHKLCSKYWTSFPHMHTITQYIANNL